MVLFRPVLGRRGSYVPSVLNILQLAGWTGFELWAMSQVANAMSVRLFGFSAWALWLVLVTILCTALALGGPILVVRRWLERFGAWVVVAVALWITIRLLTTADLSGVWSRPGSGGLTFWLAVDLVIAQPVSWLPLVADYNRFARPRSHSALGTYSGYAAGNVWFYALGALLVLGGGLVQASPAGLAQSIASLAGGWVVLLTLLVGETDEAFADIYSAAVSAQNVRERISQRRAILVVAAAGVAIAAWLGGRPASATGTYQSFLFLLGSVFVPLFGVFVADYFVLRTPRDGASRTFRPGAFAAWAIGFLVYQWSVPTGPSGWQNAMETVLHGWLRLPFPLAGSAAGASLPSFAASFAAYAGVEWVARRRRRRVSP